MAEKDNRRISQKAWGIYRADPGKTAGLLAFVYTALLICLGIGVWLGGAFVVLFLLVGVPAVFAAFLWLFSLQKQGDVLLSDFLRAYFAYFNSPFRGVLRAIASFFKSLLVFFLAVFLVSQVYYLFSPLFDPQFPDALMNLVLAYEGGDLNLFMDLLESDPSIVGLFRVLYPIVYGISAIFLSHFLFVGSIEISGRADVPRVVAEGTTVRVFSNSARKIRRRKAREYWKACWFLPIVFAFSYALGVIFGGFIPGSNLMIPTIIGLASGTLVYLVFLPYHAEAERLLMTSWEKEVYLDAVKTMRQLLVQASANHAITERGSTYFLKRVERLEKALAEDNYREIPGEEEPEMEDPFE